MVCLIIKLLLTFEGAVTAGSTGALEQHVSADTFDSNTAGLLKAAFSVDPHNSDFRNLY